MTHDTSSKPNFVRIELTPEQKAHVRASVGVDAQAIEMSAAELEERIAPRYWRPTMLSPET